MWASPPQGDPDPGTPAPKWPGPRDPSAKSARTPDPRPCWHAWPAVAFSTQSVATIGNNLVVTPSIPWIPWHPF